MEKLRMTQFSKHKTKSAIKTLSMKRNELKCLLVSIAVAVLVLFTGCGSTSGNADSASAESTEATSTENVESILAENAEITPAEETETSIAEMIETDKAIPPEGREHQDEIIQINAVYPDEYDEAITDAPQGEDVVTDNNSTAQENDTQESDFSGVLIVDLDSPRLDRVTEKKLDQYYEQAAITSAYREQMNEFYQKTMNIILTSGDVNTVFSPLNAYLAFSALAEISDGNTRKQFLDFLQVSDIESLRERVSQLMKSNIVEVQKLKSCLATSLWLSDLWHYKNETLQCLADDYCASSFVGNLEANNMNKALQTWMSDTIPVPGYASGLSLDPDAALALISTIYYQAEWSKEFHAEATEPGIFHGTNGEETVDMMHRAGGGIPVHIADDFVCVGWSIRNSGYMYFCLPAPNADVNTLLDNPEIIRAVSQSNTESAEVSLTVPKFKISADNDLKDMLIQCGVSEAFLSNLADFGSLTDDIGLRVDKIEQKAMVEIDEEGVTGAAFTYVDIYPIAAPLTNQIEVVIDRPFLFVVTGKDDSILFSGIVRNLE